MMFPSVEPMASLMGNPLLCLFFSRQSVRFV